MATLQAHFVYVGNLVDRRIIVDFEILSFQGQRSEKRETGDSSRNVHQTIQIYKKSIRLCIFVGFVMIIGYLLRFSIFKDLHEKYIYIFFLFWGFPGTLFMIMCFTCQIVFFLPLPISIILPKPTPVQIHLLSFLYIRLHKIYLFTLYDTSEWLLLESIYWFMIRVIYFIPSFFC